MSPAKLHDLQDKVVRVSEDSQDGLVHASSDVIR